MADDLPPPAGAPPVVGGEFGPPSNDGWRQLIVDGQWLWQEQEDVYMHTGKKTVWIHDGAGTWEVLPVSELRAAGEGDDNEEEVEKSVEEMILELEGNEEEGVQVQKEEVEEVEEEEVELDLVRDVVASTATWEPPPFRGSSKQGREDRHVERLVLPLDVISPTGASCVYSGVFDGHSGSSCSSYVAERMHTNILGAFRQFYQTQLQKSSRNDEQPEMDEIEILKKSIVAAAAQTDRNFLTSAAKSNSQEGQAGSTGIVTILHGPHPATGGLSLLTANVGDSRAVLGSGDSLVVRLSEDHKPNCPKERSRIERAGGSVCKVGPIWRVVRVEGRMIMGLATSRSFGDGGLKIPKPVVTSEPDIFVRSIDIDNDFCIILASDGLWDVVKDEQAVSIVRRHLVDDHLTALLQAVAALPGCPNPTPDLLRSVALTCRTPQPQMAAKTLVETAKANGTMDDVTATVVFFGWHRDLFFSKAISKFEADG